MSLKVGNSSSKSSLAKVIASTTLFLLVVYKTSTLKLSGDHGSTPEEFEQLRAFGHRSSSRSTQPNRSVPADSYIKSFSKFSLCIFPFQPSCRRRQSGFLQTRQNREQSTAKNRTSWTWNGTKKPKESSPLDGKTFPTYRRPDDTSTSPEVTMMSEVAKYPKLEENADQKVLAEMGNPPLPKLTHDLDSINRSDMAAISQKRTAKLHYKRLKRETRDHNDGLRGSVQERVVGNLELNEVVPNYGESESYLSSSTKTSDLIEGETTESESSPTSTLSTSGDNVEGHDDDDDELQEQSTTQRNQQLRFRKSSPNYALVTQQTFAKEKSIMTTTSSDKFDPVNTFTSSTTSLLLLSSSSTEVSGGSGAGTDTFPIFPQLNISSGRKKSIWFEKKFPVESWKSLGLFDDSYFENINSHWLEFDPPRPIVHKVFATLYGVFMVVGCAGNFMVIFMFFRCRSLRTPPNYLIVNLAISDFFMMAKTPIFIVNSFYHGPVLGALGCKLYGFVGGLTGTTSIMTLASIALDRYYVIVHPLNPFKRTTPRRAILMILGVWCYAAIFSAIPLYWVNNYTSEGYLTSCSFDYLADDFGSRVFIFIFFLAAWLFPLLIISFSYLNIFRIVREAGRLEVFATGNKKRGFQGESYKFRPDEGKQKSEVKIAMLACVLISLWLLAWSPYACVALLGIFGWKEYITPFISSVPALFCKTASCIDPFIYSMNHPKFQRELRSKFKICFRYHQKKRELREGSYYSGVTCRENEVSLRECFQPTTMDNLDNVEYAPPPPVNKPIIHFPITTVPSRTELVGSLDKLSSSTSPSSSSTNAKIRTIIISNTQTSSSTTTHSSKKPRNRGRAAHHHHDADNGNDDEKTNTHSGSSRSTSSNSNSSSKEFPNKCMMRNEMKEKLERVKKNQAAKKLNSVLSTTTPTHIVSKTTGAQKNTAFATTAASTSMPNSSLPRTNSFPGIPQDSTSVRPNAGDVI